MSYSPGAPENEPPPKVLRPLVRGLQRFASFCKERPVAAFLRLWVIALFVVGVILGKDGVRDVTGLGDRVTVLYAATGWIIPLVLFVRQRKSENDA